MVCTQGAKGCWIGSGGWSGARICRTCGWTLCRAVRETPEEAFPPEQWREALDYLVGEAPAEDPAPRDRLLCGLEERRKNSPLDKDGLG